MTNKRKIAQKVAQTLPENLKHLRDLHAQNYRNIRLPVVARTSPGTKAAVILSLVASAAALATTLAVSAHYTKYIKDREYRRKFDDTTEKAKAKTEEIKDVVTKKVEEVRNNVASTVDKIEDNVKETTDEVEEITEDVIDNAVENAKTAVDDAADTTKDVADEAADTAKKQI